MLDEFLKQNNMEMEDFIKIIFDFQENNNNLSKKTSSKIKEIHKEQERQYLGLKLKIEEYIQDKDIVRNIIDEVLHYKQLMLTETSILNESYYRRGFKNGICLLIECLNEEA